MTTYLLVAAVVLGVNLLPAFGPPTWAVLVWFEVTQDLHPVALVVIGATAATVGRIALATGARAFRGRLSAQRRESLDSARLALAGSRRRAAAGLGLFLVSPLPSAQLFVAAGLLAVRLRPLALLFFAGRLVSYSIYVTAGKAVDANFGDTVDATFRSPIGIALQIATLVALVALMRIDWTKLITRATGSAPRSDPA